MQNPGANFGEKSGLENLSFGVKNAPEYVDVSGRPRSDPPDPPTERSRIRAAAKKPSTGPPNTQLFKIHKKSDLQASQAPVRVASFQYDSKPARSEAPPGDPAETNSGRASRDANMPRPMTPFVLNKPSFDATFQIPSLSMRDYYRDSKLFECITAGLVMVGKERPENAVEYLGRYLLEQARLHEKK